VLERPYRRERPAERICYSMLFPKLC